MNCRKCGNAIPQGSKFCANCGTPILSRELINQQPAAKKKTATWAILAAIAAVALIILLFLFLKGTPVTSPPTHPIAEQSPVLNVPNAPPPAPDNKPPAEIVAYVEHIRQTELKRVSMRVDLKPAFEMLSKANGMKGDIEDESRAQKETEISNGVGDYTQQWQQLVTDFNSVPAPSGCESLAGSYGTALGKYSEIMIKIQTAISKQDVSTLMGMQGTAQAEVDASLIQSDESLGTVCKTYGIKKTFSVSPDKGMDSLFTPVQ